MVSKPLLFLVRSVILLLVSFSAVAGQVNFKVTGVGGQTIYEAQKYFMPVTLGTLTNEVLEHALFRKQIAEYQGNDGGVLSINRLGNALEVLSDTEMNAYGWCYKVDGVAADLLANQYELTGNESTIEWFYAYARLEKNIWTSMCVPADHYPKED